MDSAGRAFATQSPALTETCIPKVDSHLIIRDLVVSDPDLYPKRNPVSGEIIMRYVSIDELRGNLPAKYLGRLSDQSKLRYSGGTAVLCYETLGGVMVPEIRKDEPISTESAKFRSRIEAEIARRTADREGILIRGSSVGAAFLLFHSTMEGSQSGSNFATTFHRDAQDVHGQGHRHGESHQRNMDSDFGRIVRVNAFGDNNPDNDIIVRPLKPGTKPDDGMFRIQPQDMNRTRLSFDSCVTDFMTLAFYESTTGKWHHHILPFSQFGINPYDGRNHYANGFFTGIIYYEINGELYVFRLKDHAARDANRCDMQRTSVDMFEQIIERQIVADRRWVPNAHINVDNPLTGEKGLGNRGYGRLYAVSSGLAPVLAKPQRQMGMMTAPVGPYKNVYMLDTVFLGPRPVNSVLGSTKALGNYAEPVAAFKPFAATHHEAIFCAENGRIQEGIGCNYVFIQHGVEGSKPTIFVPDPSLYNDILPGINTMAVIDMARQKGYNVIVAGLYLKDVKNFDEIMVTGSAMVVRGVNRISDRNGNPLFQSRHSAGRPGPVTQEFIDDFSLIFRREHPRTEFNAMMQKIG